jgi:hypothetical protein
VRDAGPDSLAWASVAGRTPPARSAGQKRWLARVAVAVALIAAAVLSLVLLLPRYLLSWDLAGGAVRPGDRAAAVNAIRSTLMPGLARLAAAPGQPARPGDRQAGSCWRGRAPRWEIAGSGAREPAPESTPGRLRRAKSG